MALVRQSDTILQNSSGIAYAGVRVQAYLDDVEQQLYSDASSTPVSVVQTNANGLYEFWIEEGDYELRFSVGGVPLGAGDYALFNAARRIDVPASALLFGVKGDGTTDDTAAIITALEAGGSLYFPEGDYLIAAAGADAGGVYATLIRSLKVACSPKARFFTNGLDNDMIQVTVPSNGAGLPADGITFEWDGGYFDQTGQKNSTSMPFSVEYPGANPGASATADAISVRGSYTSGTVKNGFRLVRITNATFYAGAHWQTAGGDQAVFVNGADLTIVEGNKFTGSRDLGVYASWDETGVCGGRVVVRSNFFKNCFGGAAVKRSAKGFLISDNDFENCVLGAYGAHIVGNGTRDGGIRDNRFVGCQIHARLDYCFNVTICDNPGQNFGAMLADGTTRVTAYTATGYLLNGSSYCTVRNNKTFGVNAAYDAGNPVHVTLAKWNPGSGDVISSYNDVRDNISMGFRSPGEEKAGEADYNRLEGNQELSGAVPNFTPAGSHSSNVRFDYLTGRIIHMAPLLFDDGAAGAPALARRSDPTTGILFGTNAVGVSVGGTLRFNVTSTVVTSTVPVQANAGTASAPSHSFTAETNAGMYRKSTGKVGFSAGGVEFCYGSSTEGLVQKPPASVTPANNGEMVVQATSNTSLTFKLKGSDGTVRSASLTLA